MVILRQQLKYRETGGVHDRDCRNGRDEEPPRRPSPMGSLYVLCVGMLMIVLDMTVVNVALPSIQDDLGFRSRAWPGS